MTHLYNLKSYQYHLPEDLIAKHPLPKRDDSKLMVVDRKSGQITSLIFHELYDFLDEGDRLVFNNTKVIPARLIGHKKTGGKCEIFLTKRLSDEIWEALVKPGKYLVKGSVVHFDDSFNCEILDVKEDGLRLVKLNFKGQVEDYLEKFGAVPLPPYMKREANPDTDKAHYQTVYAEHEGSFAAPTAGLHFTYDLLDKLKDKGIHKDYVTLHIGLGTFSPVKVDDIREHRMHKETFCVSKETAYNINNHDNSKRLIAVGTTTCRSLESAHIEGKIQEGNYETDIFIYPGYQFKAVKHLITNFHQPGSSLMMLVSAFAGFDLIEEAYRKAIEEKYRFLSYGDAMLIL